MNIIGKVIDLSVINLLPRFPQFDGTPVLLVCYSHSAFMCVYKVNDDMHFMTFDYYVNYNTISQYIIDIHGKTNKSNFKWSKA